MPWHGSTEGVGGGEVAMVMPSLTPGESGLTAPRMRSVEAEIATPLPHHSSEEKEINQTSSMLEITRSHSEL